MIELESLNTEDKILHYLVALGITNVPTKVRSLEDYEESVRSLGEKGYLRYTTHTQQIRSGMIKSIQVTKSGCDYYNDKYNK